MLRSISKQREIERAQAAGGKYVMFSTNGVYRVGEYSSPIAAQAARYAMRMNKESRLCMDKATWHAMGEHTKAILLQLTSRNVYFAPISY